MRIDENDFRFHFYFYSIRAIVFIESFYQFWAIVNISVSNLIASYCGYFISKTNIASLPKTWKGNRCECEAKKICIHKNVCNKMVKWNRRTPLYVNTFQRIDNTCSWLYRCHCCCYSSFKAFVLIKLLLRIAKKQLNIATFQRALAVFRSFAFDFFTIYRYRSSIQ